MLRVSFFFIPTLSTLSDLLDLLSAPAKLRNHPRRALVLQYRSRALMEGLYPEAGERTKNRREGHTVPAF